jgi:beta-N-acetylhexosaminidase
LIFLIGLFPHHLLAQLAVDPVETALKKMSLEQKVGQLFMIGFPQPVVDEKLRAFITNFKPGAFLLFGRNIRSLQQVYALNRQLADLSQKVSGVRPLIAVDQEGGMVSRVPVDPPLPNALALGQTNSLSLAQMYGEEVGALLKHFGFNMNLAPVLDLSDPEQPSFIGVRSLGINPEKVGNLGHSIAKGLVDSHVVPTGKHFPGMGSSTHDPHAALATRITSLDDFYATDLKPFQKFSTLGPNSAIMLSHLSYPVLDPSNVPALFSEKVVSILRNKLHFKGIVLTDDLMMEGAAQYAKAEDAAFLALKAGADVIMVTWSFKAQERAIRRIRQAILQKELSMEQVDQKVRRVLTAKFYADSILPQRGPAALSKERLMKLERAILESNLLAQVDKLPSVRPKDHLCVISTHKHFLNSYKSGNTLPVTYVLLPLSTTSTNLERIIKKNGCHYSIFSIFGKKTAEVISGMSSEIKLKSILLNLGSPLTTLDEQAFKGVINLYFPHYEVGKRIAQHFSKKKMISDYQVLNYEQRPSVLGLEQFHAEPHPIDLHRGFLVNAFRFDQ